MDGRAAFSVIKREWFAAIEREIANYFGDQIGNMVGQCEPVEMAGAGEQAGLLQPKRDELCVTFFQSGREELGLNFAWHCST